MVMQLKEVNGLDDINKIYIGQELTLTVSNFLNGTLTHTLGYVILFLGHCVAVCKMQLEFESQHSGGKESTWQGTVNFNGKERRSSLGRAWLRTIRFAVHQ